MSPSHPQAVILSTPLVLAEGEYTVQEISLEEARDWIRRNRPVNYCGHETVRVLGSEPARTRKTCSGYDEALAIKSRHRLEFGREYTREETEAIGFQLLLITKRPTAGNRPRTSPDVRRDANINHTG